MNHGLTEDNLERIVRIFKENSAVERVILYGSRAIGTHRPGSDIDLAVLGERLTFNDLLSLSIQLEELGLLYSFDIQHYEKIQNPDLIDHIRRVGLVLYEAIGEVHVRP